MKLSITLLAATALCVATTATYAQQIRTAVTSNLGPVAVPTTPAAPPIYAVEENSVMENINRGFFGFNRGFNNVIIRPIGIVWNTIIPQKARVCVNNFGANIGGPFSALQNLMQGSPEDGATEMKRFGINTTKGVLGIFDVAKDEPKTETFANTLITWGVGPAAHLEFPVIEQTTNVRDFGGNIGEGLVKGAATFGVASVVNILMLINNGEDMVNKKNAEIATYPDDPYAGVRDAYESRRELRRHESMFFNNNATHTD